MIGDLPTELLLELRERFRSGRVQFSGLTESPESLREIERRMIEALESELRRRFH